jgi:hypothetical protein
MVRPIVRAFAGALHRRGCRDRLAGGMEKRRWSALGLAFAALAVVPSIAQEAAPAGPRMGGSIGGRVFTADGEPARRARIFVEGETTWGRAFVRTDDEGRFRALEGLGPGPFHVAARLSGPGYEPLIASARDVPSGTANLTLVVRPTGAIDVVVSGLAPGKEILAVAREPSGRVAGKGFEVLEEWFPHVGHLATASGTRVYGLEAGRYGLTVLDADRGGAAWRSVEVRPGERTRVEVVLEPATELTVHGFVDGTEVRASVVVESASVRGLVGHATCVVSSEPGERVLLPPGAYVVRASWNERSGSAEVVLAGERERALRVELR